MIKNFDIFVNQSLNEGRVNASLNYAIVYLITRAISDFLFLKVKLQNLRNKDPQFREEFNSNKKEVKEVIKKIKSTIFLKDFFSNDETRQDMTQVESHKDNKKLLEKKMKEIEENYKNIYKRDFKNDFKNLLSFFLPRTFKDYKEFIDVVKDTYSRVVTADDPYGEEDWLS